MDLTILQNHPQLTAYLERSWKRVLEESEEEALIALRLSVEYVCSQYIREKELLRRETLHDNIKMLADNGYLDSEAAHVIYSRKAFYKTPLEAMLEKDAISMAVSSQAPEKCPGLPDRYKANKGTPNTGVKQNRTEPTEEKKGKRTTLLGEIFRLLKN